VFRARREVCAYQGNERIFVYEIPYIPHFEVEIGRPYLSYGRHFAVSLRVELPVNRSESESDESDSAA